MVMDKLDIVLAIRNTPWLFAWRWKKLEHPTLHRRVVRQNDHAVIEGYPRSANTFATYAFMAAQGPSVRVGNHFHSPAQFLLAARYGVPAMLVIRAPEDAALSFMIFDPSMSAAEALRRYIGFHRPLLKISGEMVVAPFDEVTSNFDQSIERLNDKFGTTFRAFGHTEERAQALLQRIDKERDIRAAEHPTLLGGAHQKSTPSAEKKKIQEVRRQELRAPDLARLRSEATELFEHFMERT